MIYNLNELNIKNEIIIDEEVFKDEFLDKRILNLENAKVVGKLYNDVTDEVILECVFSGTMYISDSISLESIPYDFEININENLSDLIDIYQNCYKSAQNTLDLKGILWQNIVLEVPISFTKVKDAKLKGNGWELVSDEKYEDIDPRLQELEDLLKGDD